MTTYTVDISNLAYFDGIAMLEWMLDQEFEDACRQVAESCEGPQPYMPIFKFELTEEEATMFVLRWGGQVDV